MIAASIGQTQPLPELYWAVVVIWGGLEAAGLATGITLTLRWRVIRRRNRFRDYWIWTAIHLSCWVFAFIAGLASKGAP
jgi:hypothetical protein